MGLSLEQRVELGKTGLLHDIGKISIANEILDKSEPLLPEEWEEIQQHPVNGHRFLSAVVGMGEAAATVLAHHERFDGSGYPRGLRGQQIPFSARIVAVADAYDAMVNVRPYRQALTHSTALRELTECAKSQFDPDVVLAFCELMTRVSD